MTSAEENVLRAAINPWPLALGRIARVADRARDTTRKHLGTLERHGMVKETPVGTPRSKRGWMATDAGARAIEDIDAMRVSQ